MQNEFTRNEIVRGRKVIAGTQTIDGPWELLKSSMSKHSVRHGFLEAYVREFQWRFNANCPLGSWNNLLLIGLNIGRLCLIPAALKNNMFVFVLWQLFTWPFDNCGWHHIRARCMRALICKACM